MNNSNLHNKKKSYLCTVETDKMFLPTHKEDLINSTEQINNFPLSFSKIIRTN